MVGLIGAAAGLAWLYFWLRGGWFARALAFLGLAGVLIVLGGNGLSPLGFVADVAFAWVVAAIPAWVAKRRDASAIPPGVSLTLR